MQIFRRILVFIMSSVMIIYTLIESVSKNSLVNLNIDSIMYVLNFNKFS
jgi:hypothetical protein